MDNEVTQGEQPPAKPPKADESSARTGESGKSGHELAREELRAARERAKARGRQPGERARDGRYAPAGNRRRRRWSGPRPDDRDPQPLGRLVDRVAEGAGWTGRLDRAVSQGRNDKVFERWPELVGADIAAHSEPVELSGGVLSVRTDSTMWADQLRTLADQLVASIAKGVGHGVVKRLKVTGPAAPSWRHGPLRVPGRGPRDTYG